MQERLEIGGYIVPTSTHPRHLRPEKHDEEGITKGSAIGANSCTMYDINQSAICR